VVSSQDAYEDLLRWYPCASPERVSAFPFVSVAAEEWYTGDPATTAANLGLPRKFLIFPSQFWKHKNHRCLFEAIRLAAASEPDIALVCTGQMEDSRDPRHSEELLNILREPELRDRVHCLGLLDRQVQIQLLRQAAAVVQPSLFEGWSALVEDTRLLGRPLYVSDIPVHREQDPPRTCFFDPHSPEALAALLVKDWPQLEPGPDPAGEQLARSIQTCRAVDFGRRFLRIVDKARMVA
jgi:glycosyltransferase involved in cell wall biosynthesis